MSVRTDFAALLAADWAGIPALAGLRVVATERALDAIHEPTALIRMKTLARTPEAPLSHRNVGLVLGLISPHEDLDRAADQLDGWAEAALDYLDRRYIHEAANVVGYDDRLALEIPLTITAQKEA